MHFEPINSFDEYCSALRTAGFTTGNENGEGVFTLGAFYGERVHWHTEDPDTDPWEWRIRAVQERKDIAYGKFFLKKSGLITREWLPAFIAARRDAQPLEVMYAAGQITAMEKQLFEFIESTGTAPYHEAKQALGIDKDTQSSFERALVGLQMKLFILVCGSCRRKNAAGEEYGWGINVFQTMEHFFGDAVLADAEKIPKDDARAMIFERISQLNPEATPKAIQKYVFGGV